MKDKTKQSIVAVMAAVIVALTGVMTVQVVSAQAAPSTSLPHSVAPKAPVNTGIPRLPVPEGQDPLTRAFENLYLCANWSHVHPDITSGPEFDWMAMCIRAARDEIQAYLLGR